MPFHLRIGQDGRIRHAGPTLAKICPAAGEPGRSLLDVFVLHRPQPEPAELAQCDGHIVHLAPRGAPEQNLHGEIVVLPDTGEAVINLSLGIGVVAAVARHGLTVRDFAAADPTVEMLYLIEAQTLIRDELRQLAARLAAAHRAAEAQALTDALTGLGNRRAMETAGMRLAAPGADEPFALMHIDLDHFKDVNDSLGHATGDAVLCQVARVLREETRQADMVMRIGGDEFVVICRHCDDPRLVARIAGRILGRLRQPMLLAGQTCRVGASIGATLSRIYDRPALARMLADADRALYAAKAAGRGGYRLFDPGRSGPAAGGRPRAPNSRK